MEPNYRLALRINTCRQCRLGDLRTQAVPAAVGAFYERGGMAVMCEAPGAGEDATGMPLVGPAGREFDRLLSAAGVARESLLILNRVRCRPPRNRIADYPDALLGCDPWTAAELAEYNPRVVILMGATAIKPVFGEKRVGEVRGIQRATGEDFPWGARCWAPTYHPASLFRPSGRQNKGLITQDMQEAKRTWLLLRG